ncbi:hypothetical protein [Microbacterium sp. NPDC087665]
MPARAPICPDEQIDAAVATNEASPLNALRLRLLVLAGVGVSVSAARR